MLYGSQTMGVMWVRCGLWTKPKSGWYCDQIMSRNAAPRPQFYQAAIAAQWNAALKTTNLARVLSGHKKPILASPAEITFGI